jgi:hypothetical protein
VAEVGADVTGLSEGDVVFSYSPHQSVVVAAAAGTVVVPEGLDPRLAVLNANLGYLMDLPVDFC